MKVIAHRGSSQLAPENTIPAIKKAIRDGADAIEIDVQLTKDQKIVVIHDEWLNRTTNGKGFICDSTFHYIQKLDAGSWFSKRFKGVRVPLLEEIFRIVKGRPVELHVELKNNLIPYKGMEERVIKVIQQFGMEDQVILSSFRRESLEICRRLAPHIRIGYLCWSTIQPLLNANEWRSLRLYSIHPHMTLVDSKIKKLRALGYQIFPYPVDRVSQLNTCLKHQVDGVFTNSPRRVKEMIQNSK